jgi:hypothetical protein
MSKLSYKGATNFPRPLWLDFPIFPFDFYLICVKRITLRDQEGKLALAAGDAFWAMI